MSLQIFLVLWVWYFALTVFAFIRFFYRIMQVGGKGFVDIRFTVPFQYKPLQELKHYFKIAVNKNCSTTIWDSL